MSFTTDFDPILTESELRLISTLTTPAKIQAFLDELPYSTEHIYRCPLRVLRERMAHCFDGALFSAAILRCLGYPPLIMDMLPNDRDDDHMLAIYRNNGHWGAIAKSNFIGLRFREPIYRTLRELVMSYFEQFYNLEREKTLRSYTLPLNLRTFDKWNWVTSDDSLERIAQKLDSIRRVPVLTQSMMSVLTLVDERSYQAGLMGANKAGLYKPTVKKSGEGNC
jgi:hypothetical protein